MTSREIEVLERYLANPMFQSARFEELVLDDRPHRRPVRPDDIGMVDFDARLERANATQLSGLMANRILLNVYDARVLLSPGTPTEDSWTDFDAFYAPESVAHGERVRPWLERHVFDFARVDASPHVRSDAAGIGARIEDLAGHRAEQAAELNRVLSGATEPADLYPMLAIQSLAQALTLVPRPADRLLPFAVPAFGDPARWVRRIAAFGGLRPQPHSYCQYYLPSTLALLNHLNATFHPGQFFAHAGARTGWYLEARALAGVGLAGDHDEAGDPGLSALVSEVERLGGRYGLREFSRGIEEHRVLLDAHDDDRLRQFRWITSMPYYQEKARRLQEAIQRHHVEVDLDTFVESWEECSTTHVHDEDRLIVIETGEMEFWNCFGIQHKYLPGDTAFVPKHSLHGSVVFSGECVYHQPIITEELDSRFGSAGTR